jgi:putative ABC transport system permease protein
MLGTILIVFGETFSLSAKYFSQQAIIRYFTGDCIVYSDRARESPSPFSFTTPLPVLSEPQAISEWLDRDPLVERYVPIGQNFGLFSVERNGKNTDVPFFFYAVDPARYRATFSNFTMKEGPFYDTDGNGPQSGVVLSAFQVENYAKNYSVSIKAGDAVTLLSLSDGGSVNAVPSKIVGIYQPKYFTNVFNYINFLDIGTYSQLYNFTGVDSASMPVSFNNALASESDDAIFGLAGTDVGELDTRNLVSRKLSGYAMVAVRLKDPATRRAFTDALVKQGFGVKVAPWNEASGFFAYIASIIQGVIYGATFLVFLVVVFILMNTLIIGVLERTGEIGTLRAMGAEKSFVAVVFLWESFLLNGSAALAGMAVSVGLIAAFGNGIIMPDVVQQYLVGGGPLRLLISPRPFIEAFGLIIMVSLLATLYPIRVATSVTPLKAMSGN